MAKGQDEPSDHDDGKVLAPDELDISDDEHVAEIEDGRYVVSPNDPIDDVDGTTVSESSSQPNRQEPSGSPSEDPSASEDVEPEPGTDPLPSTGSESSTSSDTQDISKQQVHDWLEAEFDSSPSRYGFDVTAKFDGPVQQRQMMSNDVVTIFESLILWYAQHIDTNTPVEEVLGILLMESNVPIRYPPESLHRFVKSSGLSPDDTIADLIEAVGDDGIKF